MKERIKHIMEIENLTPSLFADRLEIGRAVVSHILNGRNNPSLDVVTRILGTMNYVDADWLISGKGNMVRAGSSAPMGYSKENVETSDLFGKQDKEENKSANNIKDTTSAPTVQLVDNSTREDANSVSSLTMSQNNDKRMNKIIIYYSDSTFEVFNPDKTIL